MSSFEEDVAQGVAALLAGYADARHPVANRPDGSAYTDDETGVYLHRWPAIDGDSVTIATYGVDDAFALSDSTIGLQLTIRSRDLDALGDMSDDAFDVLHGRHGGMIGPVRLVSARRASATNLGHDSNRRLGRSENYYLTVHRPSPNRT